MTNARRRPRVMVIDDDEGLLEIAGLLLERAGFEAVTLGSGPSTRAELEPAPDLVLLDLNMPVQSGDELMRRMRESPALRHVPVVFFSSNDEAELRRLALGAGAQGYITKSEMGRDLAAQVSRFLPAAAGVNPAAAPPTAGDRIQATEVD
jgi:two-component system, OmpR family, response regulator